MMIPPLDGFPLYPRKTNTHVVLWLYCIIVPPCSACDPECPSLPRNCSVLQRLTRILVCLNMTPKMQGLAPQVLWLSLLGALHSQRCITVDRFEPHDRLQSAVLLRVMTIARVILLQKAYLPVLNNQHHTLPVRNITVPSTQDHLSALTTRNTTAQIQLDNLPLKYYKRLLLPPFPHPSSPANLLPLPVLAHTIFMPAHRIPRP